MAVPVQATQQQVTLSATTTAALDIAVNAQIATLMANLASGPTSAGEANIVPGSITIGNIIVASVSTTGAIANCYCVVHYSQIM